ncbi:hypothetical protein H4R19_005444 [Coemansia spiralis]|nr:hypothetical protein H4R19_005444 [Coemansia spiralis]
MRWRNTLLAGATLLLAHPWQANGWTVIDGIFGNLAARGPLARGPLAERAVGGCPAGFTNCDVFGCIQGDSCPQPCSKRGDRTSCAYSLNGVGCKWTANKCITDVQCNIAPDGSCPVGCQGCGTFQCISADLKCPVPCKYRQQGDCNTSQLYNGIGCAWNKNKCLSWDVINAMPLDAAEIVAIQDLSPVPSGAVTDPKPQQSESESSKSKPPYSRSSESESSESSESSSHAKPTHSESESSESHSESKSESKSESRSESHSASRSESRSESPLPTAHKPGNGADHLSSESSSEGEGTTTGGISTPMLIAIIVGVLIVIGLISWAGLRHFTKKKKQQQNAKPAYTEYNDYEEEYEPNADGYYDDGRPVSAYNSLYDHKGKDHKDYDYRETTGGWER